MQATARSTESDPEVRSVEAWTLLIDELLGRLPPENARHDRIASRLEELRHKRNALSVKLLALQRHRSPSAQVAYDRANGELRTAWSSTLRSIQAAQEE